MKWFWIAAGMGGIWLMGRKGTAKTDTGKYDALIETHGRLNAVEPALIKAIIRKESSWNPRAYNPEGLNDPNQGSFGLGQINHTRAFSWARYFGIEGALPARLYDPETNISLTARVLRYFSSKGFNLSTIDIYNVGETQWMSGVRNPDYRDKVNQYYQEYKGA